jgi:hypothetical protein
MHKAGEEGQDRVSLCKHGTSSRQDSTQSDKEAFGDLEGGALCQPDPSTSYHPYPSLLLDVYLSLITRAASILSTANDMHNG